MSDFDRRDFLRASALLAAWSASSAARSETQTPKAPSADGKREWPELVTPDGATLPYRLVDGVKVFHLVAEEVEHEFAPGLTGRCWGYNGRVHGPTLVATEGDRVRVYVTNRLPAPTTVHWHGVFLPSGMDGVGGLNQPVIQPGQTFRYEWTFRQHGTFMYHPHHDEMTQMGMGMMGMIVVRPREATETLPDRDYAIMLSEWRIDPGTYRPNVNEMTEFNVLTMNGRCFPGTAPLWARTGERVRIRFGNLGAMDHHPIHLHGFRFQIVATDGGPVPTAARWPETTVLVPVGSTRDIEFVADTPGDWAMHCHMTHHVMNQMGHGVGSTIGVEEGRYAPKVRELVPGFMAMGADGMGEHGMHVEHGHMPVPANTISMVGGHGPYGYITMGGMFTLLKVRDSLTETAADRWYRPRGDEQARQATSDELRRDGVGTADRKA